MLVPEKEGSSNELWKSTLHQYGYGHTDEFDLKIAELVENGYVDNTSFLEIAREKNDEVIAAKQENSLRKAWSLFHDSFEDNEAQIVENLYKSTISNVKVVSPANLNATVSLLRELKQDEKANSLIDKYIELKQDKPGVFNLEDYPFSGDVNDEIIIEKFAQQKNALSKEDRTIKQVIEEISEKDGWSDKDEKILSNTTEDEYYQLFKSEHGDNLSRWITTCLRFGQFSNATDRQKLISQNAKNALRKIASESTLNAIRVRRYLKT